MSHELRTVDPASAVNLYLSEDGKLVLAANGEIYNHRVASNLKENIILRL
jgi:asparagine synthase (glutamine-hydrolysing)